MDPSIETSNPGFNRRDLLKTGLVLAGGAILPSACKTARANANSSKQNATKLKGCRKLGTLEVFGVGIGVQNMSRTYQTTIPSRPEMHNIIRTAFDCGVTFYDVAEAYGPKIIKMNSALCI